MQQPSFKQSASTVPGIAFFDFDATLIHGDSLLMFVGELVGHNRAKLAFLDALRSCTTRKLRGRLPGVDFPGSVKTILLRRTLCNIPLKAAEAAAERLRGHLRWHQPMLDKLLQHKRAGDRVVIATGALNVYMPVLLRGLPVDDLLATPMEVHDGILTGQLSGSNCVRLAKAERVRNYLAENGPFARSYGYGNRPSDLPMLEVVDDPTIIRIPRGRPRD